MPLRDELRERVWPSRPDHLDIGDYAKGCYVREGHVVNRALGLQQDVSEPIPAGECAITSLCLGPNGKVYGATSGTRSHLFYYDPDPGADCVCDVGVLDGAAAVRRSLVAGPAGAIFGAVSETLDPDGDGYLFAYPTHRDQKALYDTRHSEIARLAVPVEGQRVAALAIDPDGERLYGLSTPDGIFFVYEIDKQTVRQVGPVNAGKQFSETLVTDLVGNVYGVGAAGRLFRYCPHTDEIEQLDVRLPSVAGRDFYNRLDAAALDPRSGRIYGGGSADGVLFEFDPRALRMRNLGKPTAASRVRAITVGADGRVYGVSGDVDGMAHLFRYDPEAHDLCDLGIPFATVQRHWHGYEFDAACTGPWGEIYLGESDRVSHLFIYFPPVAPPPHPETDPAV